LGCGDGGDGGAVHESDDRQDDQTEEKGEFLELNGQCSRDTIVIGSK